MCVFGNMLNDELKYELQGIDRFVYFTSFYVSFSGHISGHIIRFNHRFHIVGPIG